MSGFWKPAPVVSSSEQQVREGGSRNEEDFALQASFSRSRAPLAQQRLLLPIYKHKKQILYAVEEYGIVVIVGETGKYLLSELV